MFNREIGQNRNLEFEIKTPDLDVPFGDEHNFLNKMGEIREALEINNPDVLARLLTRRRMELMVIRKGEHGKYLELLKSSVEKIIGEVLGCTPQEINTPEQFQKIISAGIDPMILSEWCNIMFHLKQDSVAYSMAKLVIGQSPDLVSVANCHNFLASSFRRNGNQELGSEHDRQGLTLLKSMPDFENNPVAVWQALKMEHGLLTSRSSKKPNADMIDQFVLLAERRRQLGDVMQVGRSYLDAGRIANQIGDEEKTIYYLELALQQLDECGYVSSAVDAANLLGQVRKERGEERKARRVWVKGVEFAEQLQESMPDKVESVKENRDSLYKIPATCLVQIGDDSFLLELDDQDQLSGILLDQESNKNGEAILRKKLGNLLSALSGEEVILSQRKTGIYLKAKNTEGDKKSYQYKVEITFANGAAGQLKTTLDKNPKMRYAILSWSELVDKLESLDSQTKTLVQGEKQRRTGQ